MSYARVLAGFALAGFVLYWLYFHALAGHFMYDDNVTIVNNAKIQSDSIPVVLFEDPFRALPNLTFAAQYHLHFNPALARPQARPSPSNCRNRGTSGGVEIRQNSRMPPSMSVVRG